MSDVTVTGLAEFIADLTSAQSKAMQAAEQALARGAANIKAEAVRRASGIRHAPAYPRSIGYDLYHLPFQSRVRVGPDKTARQGALGNILEYGTINNPPRPHLGPALAAEIPRFEGALAALGQQLLEGA